MPTEYTVFRTYCIGLLDAEDNRSGTREVTEHYHMPGGSPEGACEDLISNLAEDSDLLEDIDEDDDEYESIHATCMDDLPGIFRVYQGTLTECPDQPALFEDGDIGEPLYWTKAPQAA